MGALEWLVVAALAVGVLCAFFAWMDVLRLVREAEKKKNRSLMSDRQIEEILSRIQFPGARFKVHKGVLRVLIPVVERNPPHWPAEAYNESVLQPDDDIIDVAYSALQDIYLHEVAEHFMVDGVRIHDPHKAEND